ncbi:MAG: FAD-dependent oxidoreductase [Actinomycetota bacterium]|nr:FAD-dependent oxidoreductase [Actinomycetota bacterium]
MSLLDKEYDVLVVGAGVAGVHAAYAAALKQAEVLLLTSSWDTVATLAWGPSWQSANLKKQRPLPGFAGKALAKSLIYQGQRGEGLLTLTDSFKYQGAWKHHLERMAGVTVFQDTCEALEADKRGWTALTSWGASLKAKTAMLAIGPFLQERAKTGEATRLEGRPGETGAERLIESIASLGIGVSEDECRAAPTVAAHSINWDLVRKGAAGKSAGPVGVVYWTKAAGRGRIELAPTSVAGDQIYLQGWKNQPLQDIAGLEKAHTTRPAFSVKYLTVSRQVMDREHMRGLFFAGRLAGAKSYGESAEQGLRAGAAAANVSRET